MTLTLHKQKGYLLIVAVIIIFIFSVVGSLLAVGYVHKGNAVLQSQQSQQALYIATSGLEMAKSVIINGSKTCSAITGDGQFTNASLLGGRVTVTGSEDDLTGTLSGGINASATSLTLSNAGSFPAEGVIVINNEKIGYYNKSGNVLQDLKRGLGGTTATSHSSSDVVSQNQCLLTSTGAMPDFTSPQGEQTVQEVLSIESSGGGTLSVNTPVIMTASTFDLRGSATVYNRGVDIGSPEYPGSTILSGGQVDLRGSAATYVGNGSGGIVLSSTASNVQPDIQEYDSSINSNNMYQFFFSQPLTTISSIADHGYNKNNLNGVTGKTVWIDGDLKLNGNNTYNIGTSVAPVVLVIDGDFTQNGSSTINLYGLVYITGDLKLNGSASFNGEGAVAAEGEAKVTGSMNLDLNPSALGNLSIANPYMNSSTSYAAYLFRRVNV